MRGLSAQIQKAQKSQEREAGENGTQTYVKKVERGRKPKFNGMFTRGKLNTAHDKISMKQIGRSVVNGNLPVWIIPVIEE